MNRPWNTWTSASGWDYWCVLNPNWQARQASNSVSGTRTS